MQIYELILQLKFLSSQRKKLLKKMTMRIIMKNKPTPVTRKLKLINLFLKVDDILPVRRCVVLIWILLAASNYDIR